MLSCGMAGFALIVVASFLRGTKDKFEDFCVGAAIPIFLLLLLPFELATSWLRPVTIDGWLRTIDLALGLDGFAMTRWLQSHNFYFMVHLVYPSLPLLMALAWAFERPRALVRAAALGAVLAFPLYLVFPAAGPKYAFGDFPSNAARLVPVDWVHPRNCVPSMHFTWAFLLALNVRDRRWRWIFIVYAVLMAFATVARGEHYFIDVLVAIPFAFAVQWIAEMWPASAVGVAPVPVTAGAPAIASVE